jgi:hypothetical protein
MMQYTTLLRNRDYKFLLARYVVSICSFPILERESDDKNEVKGDNADITILVSHRSTMT